MILPELLACLRCPETRQPLRLADAALLTQVNRAIAAGTARNRAGETLGQPLDGGLVREDGQVLYPIVDGIPTLLVDEGLPLDELRAAGPASPDQEPCG
jgi:uncharacterized protein YbaR (Trm112 family)